MQVVSALCGHDEISSSQAASLLLVVGKCKQWYANLDIYSWGYQGGEIGSMRQKIKNFRNGKDSTWFVEVAIMSQNRRWDSPSKKAIFRHVDPIFNYVLIVLNYSRKEVVTATLHGLMSLPSVPATCHHPFIHDVYALQISLVPSPWWDADA